MLGTWAAGLGCCCCCCVRSRSLILVTCSYARITLPPPYLAWPDHLSLLPPPLSCQPRPRPPLAELLRQVAEQRGFGCAQLMQRLAGPQPGPGPGSGEGAPGEATTPPGDVAPARPSSLSGAQARPGGHAEAAGAVGGGLARALSKAAEASMGWGRAVAGMPPRRKMDLKSLGTFTSMSSRCVTGVCVWGGLCVWGGEGGGLCGVYCVGVWGSGVDVDVDVVDGRSHSAHCTV